MFLNIQRWSLHDGAGIRTTVFFKGCPLRCRWCSNPESWRFEQQLLVDSNKCIGCGRCLEACPAQANILDGDHSIHKEHLCLHCKACVDICPSGAREMVGQDLSVEEIIQVVERDAVFYRSSGGGVTFSGGEPFAQGKILNQLTESMSDNGIEMAVETCGYFPLEGALAAINRIDTVFIDFKHSNDDIHQQLTGVSNKCIIRNIVRLDEMGRALTLRIPLVKGLTDTPDNIRGVVDVCQSLDNLIKIELLPYHCLGAGKYAQLNLPYDDTLTAPEEKTIQWILNTLHSHGLKAECATYHEK